MKPINFAAISLPLILVIAACAPITPIPQIPTPRSQSSQSSSGSPAGLPPVSSLPSGSPSGSPPAGTSPSMPAGSASSNSGQQQPSSPGAPGVPGPRSQSTGDTSDAGSEEGWLEGSARQDGDGEWQTSNQTLPEGSAAQQQQANGNGNGNEEDVGVAAEDDELAAALSDLDGSILAERETLKNNEKPGSRSQQPEEPQTNSAGTTQTAATIARGRIGDTPAPPQRGDNNTATELPDAKDDDIIARQLREAAMQETDPQLKEKLWAEYQRYKRG